MESEALGDLDLSAPSDGVGAGFEGWSGCGICFVGESGEGNDVFRSFTIRYGEGRNEFRGGGSDADENEEKRSQEHDQGSSWMVKMSFPARSAPSRPSRS